MADELVPIRFEGEAEVHYVPFSELLNLDSSSPIEERTIGQVVMAPWESSCGHGHSRAVILSEEETSKGWVREFCQCVHVLNVTPLFRTKRNEWQTQDHQKG